MPARPGKWTASSRTKAWVDPEFEPHFHQIVDLFVVVRPVLLSRETRLGALGEPGVRAFAFESVGDPRIDLFVEQDFVTALANENRQRNAPGALARQHPVGFARNHPLDTVFAGRRHPTRVLDRLDRDGAQGLTVLARSANGLSIARNHCGVLRKMIGFFDRHE